MTVSDFDIRDCELIPAKKRGKFTCPLCGGEKLSINKTTGAFTCYDGCGPREIVKLLTVGQRDERSEEERQRWREEKEREEQTRRNKLLDIDTRHFQYQRLLGALRLSPEHREELEEERGLTRSEIILAAKLGFRTNQPNRSIWDVTADLAGIRKEGSEYLLCGGRGILIPILDHHNRIQAIKVKTDFALDENGQKILAGDDGVEFPKYYYLTSAKYGGNGPQLKETGLLPLAHWRHPEAVGIPSQIFYVEGELKSFIVACKLWANDKDVLVIGASGGNFAGLDPLLAALPTLHTLLPDAGSSQNRHVAANYLALRKLCPDLVIADWEQWNDKSKLDADELLVAGGDFGLGEWEDFIALIPPAPKQSEPSEEERREFLAKEQLAYWQSLLKFTPTENVTQEFLDLSFSLGECLAIASPTGTGKTQLLIKWTRENKLQIINVGSRNSLMINTSARFNHKESGANVPSYHIHEKDAELMLRDENVAIHLCIDSIMKIPVHSAEGRVVVIDETVSVLFHALHGSKKSIRVPMLKRFDEILAVADGVVLLDANMNDWVAAAIHARCQHLKLRKVKNLYRATRWNAVLLKGATNADGNISSIDKSPIIRHLLSKALDGEQIAVVSDSQKLLEVVDGLSAKEFSAADRKYTSLRIDGEVGLERMASVKDFLANPNAYLAWQEPQILMLSPAASSGLDVSIDEYFTHQYCLFSWIDTDSQIQMMGRVRHCQERIIGIPNYASVSDKMFRNAHNLETLRECQAAYIRQIARVHSRGAADPADLEEGILNLFKENKSAWDDVANRFTIKHWYERHNMQACLQWRLEEAGHSVSVIEMDSDAAIKTKTKEEREALINARSLAVYSAPEKFSVTEAMNILQRFGASLEDRQSAEKTMLLHSLPGIKETTSWSPALVRKILFDDGDWRSRLELYYFLAHPEIAANIALGFWDNAAYGATGGRFFIPDKMKDRELIVHALAELGLMQFVYSDDEWAASSPEVLELINVGSRANIVAALRGKSPGKLADVGQSIRYFQDMLAMVGVCLKSKRCREGGELVRFYSINQEKLAEQDRLDTLNCITARLAERDWYEPIEAVPGTSISLNCPPKPKPRQLRNIVIPGTASTPPTEPIPADLGEMPWDDFDFGIDAGDNSESPSEPGDTPTDGSEKVVVSTGNAGHNTTKPAAKCDESGQFELFNIQQYEEDDTSLYGDYFS